MKVFLALTLLTSVLGAPTPTIDTRALGDLSSFDAASFASLLPSLGGGSSSGFDLGSLLSGLGGSSNTRQSDSAGCNPLTFIFARGTTELGTMGTVVGPAVGNALKAKVGTTVEGVDYPASAAGNALLGAEGGPEMAKMVQAALQKCPNTKVVLGGYSQGAMVVHNAADRLTAGQVVGAVTFGDPFKAISPKGISKFKTFCANGDPVCANGFNVIAHLTYGSNAKEAAQFLLDAAGL